MTQYAKMSEANQKVINTGQSRLKSYKDNRTVNTSMTDPHTNPGNACHMVRHVVDVTSLNNICRSEHKQNKRQSNTNIRARAVHEIQQDNNFDGEWSYRHMEKDKTQTLYFSNHSGSIA